MLPLDNRRRTRLRTWLRKPIKWTIHHGRLIVLIITISLVSFIGYNLFLRDDLRATSALKPSEVQRYMRDLPFARPANSGNAERFLQDRVHNNTYVFGFTSDMPVVLLDQSLVPRTTAEAFNETIQASIQYMLESDDKRLPYGTNRALYERYPVGSIKWLNTFGTFPGITPDHLHGRLGVTSAGAPVYLPKRMPPDIHRFPTGYEAALKLGGFYHNLSEALPLDRIVPDYREPICRGQHFDLSTLPDASIVITFFNEPFSTLMRTVHSVLNTTPPELIREIILVDDHSDYFWVNGHRKEGKNKPSAVDVTTSSAYLTLIEEYIRYLPKVKLMRLPERRGLVHARLAGARAANGSVLVVLDSHVEVNTGWLEPQLRRIQEKPNTIVFPQILAINPENFKYDTDSGIGCKLGFRWSMIEQSSISSKVTDPAPVASGSMAGGLFAVDRDYFWHLGGYDEGFRMWGSENVEMGFRTWLCGGSLECLPCSKTFHIYRKKGGGYSSPPDDIVRNKLRTARLWTDEYYPLARTFIAPRAGVGEGDLNKMLELKERLKCRPFQWYLDHVEFASNNKFTSLKPGDVRRVGELRAAGEREWCLDTMQRVETGQKAGLFPCHGEGGTQAWLYIQNADWSHIVPTSHERYCLGRGGVYAHCDESDIQQKWEVSASGGLLRLRAQSTGECLSFTKAELGMRSCEDDRTRWRWPLHMPKKYEPLRHTPEWLEQQRAFNST